MNIATQYERHDDAIARDASTVVSRHALDAGRLSATASLVRLIAATSAVAGAVAFEHADGDPAVTTMGWACVGAAVALHLLVRRVPR